MQAKTGQAPIMRRVAFIQTDLTERKTLDRAAQKPGFGSQGLGFECPG